MIKANKGTVELSGSENTLLAELSCVTNAFKEVLEKDHSEEEAKEIVMTAVEVGLMSQDELDKNFECAKELEKTLKEFSEKLSKILAEGLGE